MGSAKVNDLVIIFPKEVIESLGLKEGCLVEIESFTCSGTSGVRIRPNNDNIGDEASK